MCWMKRQYIGITVVILACICMAMVPFLYLRLATGSFLPVVMPEFHSDLWYYITQIDEVMSGRWLLGNPYFIEYGHMRSPAILLPIWIAAIPGLLGLPINTVFAINIFIYTIVIGILFYILLSHCTKKNVLLTVLLSILGVGYVHNLIVRPAVMQTVYPVFLLFLITFLLYLEQPNNKKKMLCLIVAIALSFYIYLHLWMITFTMLGLLLLWNIIRRQYSSLRSIVTVILLSLILCIPQILVLIGDSTNPMFADISYRNGLIKSHLVHPITILNLKYTILTAITLALLYRKRLMPKSAAMVLLASMGIIIAATSNIFTGMMLDFMAHPWRLSLIITPLAIACFILIAWKEKDRQLWEKIVAGLVATILLGTAINHTFIRMNSFGYLRNNSEEKFAHKSMGEYAQVLDFLNTLTPKRQVILAGSRLDSVIPLYTDHTLLFYAPGRYNVIPTKEHQERFLVQYVDHITPDFLRQHLGDYIELGVFREQEYAEACKTVPFCKTDSITDITERAGGNSMIQEKLDWNKEIDNNYEEWLKRFSVSLIAVDKEQEYSFRIPESAVRIYDDKRVSVWQLKAE